MPSGKAHSVATTLLCSTTGLLMLSGYVAEIGVICLGQSSGLLLDPDLDIEGWTESEGRAIRWFGPVGRLLFALYYPYGKIFKHRGISHWPIVGTFTRVWPIVFLCYVIDWKWIALWFVGLCSADILHSIMDWSTSKWLYR